MSEMESLPIKDTAPQLGRCARACSSLSEPPSIGLHTRFLKPYLKSRLYTGYISILLALGLGGTHTLTFAPTPYGGWLALLSLSAFFILLAYTPTAKAAAWRGFAFGIGHFGSGLAWLIVSPYIYGGLPLTLSVLIVLLCVLYLSLYPALASWAWSASLPLQKAHTSLLTWHSSVGFACLWTLSEWLRGTIFTGFPWLVSGYTQVDGPLTGYARILGVYGISWVLAWIAALIAQAVIAYRTKLSDFRSIVWIRLLLCAALIGTAAACLHFSWTHPQGKPLTIRLLQGNVPQSMKVNASNVEGMLALYQNMITEAPADLILTPETAAPLPIDQLPDNFAYALRQFSDQTGSSILLGAIGQASIQNQGGFWTNSLFGIMPNTLAIASYNKRHLVPFGEYIPWGFKRIMAYLQLPLDNFTKGTLQQADFAVHDQTIAAGICYEDIFGEELARTLRQANPAASILVNATNLGWFGNTIALDQHRQMAQMRALETARPMLSAANTGITAAIDPQGKVIAELPPFITASLEVTIQGQKGKTPYIVYGNTPVLIGCFSWLVWIGIYTLRARKKR